MCVLNFQIYLFGDLSRSSIVTFLIGKRRPKIRGSVAGGETKPSVSTPKVIGCRNDRGEGEGGKSQVEGADQIIREERRVR